MVFYLPADICKQDQEELDAPAVAFGVFDGDDLRSTGAVEVGELEADIADALLPPPCEHLLDRSRPVLSCHHGSVPAHTARS